MNEVTNHVGRINVEIHRGDAGSAKIAVATQFNMSLEQLEDTGYYACSVPSYQIYFTANSVESGKKRATTIVTAMLKYWICPDRIDGFISEMSRLGFHAEKSDKNTLLTGMIKSAMSNSSLLELKQDSLEDILRRSGIGAISVDLDTRVETDLETC